MHKDSYMLHFWCPNLKSKQKGVLWEPDRLFTQSLCVNETRLAEESQNIAPLCNTLRGRKGASALSKLPWNKDVWVRSMLLIGEC